MVAAPHDFRSSMNGGTVGCAVGFLNSLRINSSFSLVSSRSSIGSRVNIFRSSSDAKMAVCKFDSNFTNSSSKDASDAKFGAAIRACWVTGTVWTTGVGPASKSIKSSKPFTGTLSVSLNCTLYMPKAGSDGESGTCAKLGYTTCNREPCMSARSWRS